ncbi:hypothetical protein Glove_139g117 [Diversispora epigaea]|uniref:Uncharacterized protein n=1 Tax=Diversispora epigaea TaxID=1348612 RepID=A0A397J511_9GLOM|nr:hypothetical protein Glove_139g117 [Diversispora epigaea]
MMKLSELWPTTVIPKNFLKHYKRSSKIENNNKNNSNGNDAESDDLVQTNSTNSRISMNLSTVLMFIGNLENGYQARKKLALREIMRAIIQKAIEEYKWSIFGINVCFTNMNVLNSLSLQKIESADEVYELLSHEVSHLQELYIKCAKI